MILLTSISLISSEALDDFNYVNLSISVLPKILSMPNSLYSLTICSFVFEFIEDSTFNSFV